MTIQSATLSSQVNPNNLSVIALAAGEYLTFISDGTAYTGTGGNPSTNVAGTLMKLASTGVLTPLVTLFTTEDAQDAFNLLFTSSGGTITGTYNDAGNTFNFDVNAITSAKVSDFTEAAQDAVLAVISNSDGSVVVSYNDAGNAETITVGVISDTQHGNRGGGALHAAATTTTAGFLSAADKLRLDHCALAFYNVLDNGISTTNSAAVNDAAWTALMTVIADNATVWFPPNASTYDFSAARAIPAGKHLTVQGAGAEKTVIRDTNATQDGFTCGDWYQTFRGFKLTSSVTKTAGRGIYSGNNVAIDVIEVDFDKQWDGLVYSGGASAGNLAYVQNCSWTDIKNRGMVVDGANANMYMDSCTMDSPLGQAVANLEINQCGSLVVSNCDFIRAQNNLKVNPTSPNGVFSCYFVNTFFDTSSASSVKFMGTGNIQRFKFVSCWFSGSVTGCEFASTAATLPTAIDFIGCDIFGNSSRGIYASGVQDFSATNCRISGNTTAGIEVVASAGAVTALNVQNTRIGPTAGFGANGTGILINAGTYASIVVEGNDMRGNTTPLTNGATAASPQYIAGNVGLPISNGALVTAVALAATTTYVTPTISAPANSLRIGSTFRFRVLVSNAATVVTTTILGKAGPNGTTADTTVVSGAVSPATVGAVGAAEIEVTMVVRSIGATGVIVGSTRFTQTGGFSAALAGSAVLATATVNTGVANFFGVALTESAASVTVQAAFAEVVNQ